MDHTASHPLPDVGSFSYSWPTSKPERQPEERLDHGDAAGSIGTDPASASQCSFDFRVSPPQQTVDAGQMFLDGLLLPLQLASRHGQEDGDPGREGPVLARALSLDSSQRMVAPAAASSRRYRLPLPASQNSSPCGGLRSGRGAVTPVRGAVFFRECKLRLPSFGRCGKRRRWMPFRFLAPLCRKIVRCVWRRKAMDAEYGGDNVKLCDSGKENAIRDAILHCKRSL
ncbi:hypothetical protein C2845_PM07G22260 [Panicum miliaceum]|uniref:Membrane-associated kinase regulator 6 n=1 Tax=Panicum miliaceum TaxID=4540 RepID=A0A3L6SKY4_PANMI|nr:hypothetical protein C2845_PM07G22260 [Panicum miliaceum]